MLTPERIALLKTFGIDIDAKLEFRTGHSRFFDGTTRFEVSLGVDAERIRNGNLPLVGESARPPLSRVSFAARAETFDHHSFRVVSLNEIQNPDPIFSPAFFTDRRISLLLQTAMKLLEGDSIPCDPDCAWINAQRALLLREVKKSVAEAGINVEERTASTGAIVAAREMPAMPRLNWPPKFNA